MNKLVAGGLARDTSQSRAMKLATRMPCMHSSHSTTIFLTNEVKPRVKPFSNVHKLTKSV